MIYDKECLWLLDVGVPDFVSSAFVERLSDVSELPLSLSLSLLENTFINIRFDITAPFALFIFSPFFSTSPFSALSSSLVGTDPHSSSVLVLELPPGARPMAASAAIPPLDVTLSCSKKRTCTTTRKGSRSF
ncbi:hypothetical protein Hanom_Chr09g00860771 [Helianthus anomalus]